MCFERKRCTYWIDTVVEIMFKFWLLCSAILALNGAGEIAAFNLDVENFIKHDGVEDSMFGFSVALHKEQQTSWLV